MKRLRGRQRMNEAVMNDFQDVLALSSEAILPKRMMDIDQAMLELPNMTPQVCSDATLAVYLNALYKQGRERHTPNISPLNTVFLQSLLRQHMPQNLLEIGCANGYSTLRFWQIVRAWQARITTFEVSRPNIVEAERHFAVTGANQTITLHEGNALTMLNELPVASFDFIFIDARKIYTLDFFVHARRLAAPDALIVIDDVVKFKEKMQNFYDYLQSNGIEYQIEQIEDDEDGVMLVKNTK